MIKFPRPTIRVGKCIAVIRTVKTKLHPRLKGKPIFHDRPCARYNGKPWNGARLAYHLNIKKVRRLANKKKSNFTLHTCDNGWCINPHHIYLGSPKQNCEDFMARYPKMEQHKKRISLKIKKIWEAMSPSERKIYADKMTKARKDKYPTGSNISWRNGLTAEEKRALASKAALALWDGMSKKEREEFVAKRAAGIKRAWARRKSQNANP